MERIQTPYVDVKEWAARSGLSIYFCRKAIADGIVIPLKSGKKYYVHYEDAMAKLRVELSRKVQSENTQKDMRV